MVGGSFIPANINLSRALEKGYLKEVKLKGTQAVRPATNKKWLILSGAGYFVTGTDTYCFVQDRPTLDTLATTEKNIELIIAIDAGQASGHFNPFGPNSACAADFSAALVMYASPWRPIMITSEQSLALVGNASATLNFQVLEWDSPGE